MRWTVFIGSKINLGLLLLAALCLHGQVAGTAAKRTFTHDRDVETAFEWQDLPRWEGETLLGYIGNLSSGPVIYSMDRNGRRDETLFTLEDGARITIYDIAGSPGGEIALVGGALSGDIRYATFLARIAPDRKHQTITRTFPYSPTIVTFAPDGAVWTIGNLNDDENTHTLAKHVLRRFDPSGRMIGSATLQVKGWRGAAASFLRASRDRVGWFTASGEYIEFSLDGTEMGRYEGPAVVGPRDITGMVLSGDNDVIVSVFGNGKAEFVALDREQRTWIPVSVAKEHAPAWARVLGFDGTTLVTYSQNGRLTRFKTTLANLRGDN
jgi:hypothetical protein